MTRFYTLPEAAAEAGMEYRTLHSWVQRGLLSLENPARGTGRPAYLVDHEVELCKVLARLRRAGCGIEILERAAKLHIPGARLTKFELAEGLVLTLKPSGHRRTVA
jgi:DNA-binding transcriptional MerR regulator